MSTGRRSPPSTTGPTEENIADIGFDYAESGLNIFNNGHTVEVEYDEGSSVGLGGETYEVAVPLPCGQREHTVDGEQHPMELHIVHRTPDERLAVVGIFLEVGGENVALAPVFDNLPTEVSDEAAPVEGETVDLAALPETQTYFQYDGSLTTPPCTEGVAWQVLDTPVEISQEQLDAFTAVVEGNFRPTQPLGDRELVRDAAADE